jgi:uncharacterized protein (DUF305 family)
MKLFTVSLAAGALALSLTSVAVAQHAAQSMAPMDAAAMQQMLKDMMPAPSDSPSTKAFKEGDMKMMQGMHLTYTGDPDVDFVRGMMAHHQGAIDMANVELQYGKDPANQKLAQDIIDAQNKEIDHMNAWLKKHGQ